MNDIIRQTKTGRTVIRSEHRRRSIRAATLAIMLQTVSGVCLLGGTLQLFCLSQGADDLYLGVLNFLIWGGGPFLLLGISLMRRFSKRHILVVGSGLVPSLCMAFTVLLPAAGQFGWLSQRTLLNVLLVIMLLRSIANCIGTSAWFPMLHDNVPSRVIGKFFGTFRFYWQVCGLVSILLIACFLKGGPTREPAWWKFCVVFAVGELCMILKTLALRHLKEKPLPPQPERPASTWRLLKQTVADPQTRHFMSYVLLYTIPVYMCLPFQIKYLKDLGYSAGYIVAATSMVSLGAILSLRFWGKLADRFGNRSIFSISQAGIVVVLAGWTLVGQNAFSAVFVFVLYAGWCIFQSGNGIAQTRHTFHTVSETDQSNLVIYNTLWLTSVGLAPLISGLFLRLSATWSIQVSGLDINNYQMLFLLAAVLIVIPYRICKKFQNNVETPTVKVLAIVTRPLREMFGAFVSFPTKRNNK